MAETDKAERKAISEQIAEFLILPINTSMDLAMGMRPHLADEMRERLEGMRERESVMAAFPTPETMHKAEELRVDNDLFECMLNLVIKREAQKELKAKDTTSPGEAILRQMGF